jgi:hypothetical protein
MGFIPIIGTKKTGDSLSFVAFVTGSGSLPAPTGTVIFTVSGQANTCTSTPAATTSGQTTYYTCNIDAPVAGAYTVSATYNGNTNYTGATAGPITVNVISSNASIVIVISPATPNLGNAITFTAAVVGVTGGARPTGTMTWTVTGGQKSACDSFTGPNPGTNGITAVYTCVLNAANAGDYTVVATYPGDNNYNALAATVPTTVTIPKVTPTAVLTGVGDGVLAGNAVFTLTVTGPAGATAPSGNPIWSFDPSETSGVTACDGTPPVTVSGSVTTYVCNVTETSYGTYIVRVSYPGDSNYLAAISNTTTVAVQSLVPVVSITISASSSPTLGGVTTLTSRVTGPSGTSSAATAATSYSCPSGVLPSGSSCNDSGVITPATPTTTYSCASGRLAGQLCFTGDFIPAGTMNWTVTDPLGVSVPCTTVDSG